MDFQSSAALREMRAKSGQRRFDGDHGARIPCLFKAGPSSILTFRHKNISVRMAPSMRHRLRRGLFHRPRHKTIPGGGVLWRGYFQSVRPSSNRLLVNINISTGAMYTLGASSRSAWIFLLIFLVEVRNHTLSSWAGFPTASAYVSRISLRASRSPLHIVRTTTIDSVSSSD
jgi:hypothetical protein